MPESRINSDTGLFTRSLIEVLLNHEVARAQRYPAPLTLMCLALHLPESDSQPDLAHARIVDLLNTNLRATDVTGHFNDEYLILLPATPLIGGLIVASRLADRAKILHPVDDSQRSHFDLAICIGISHYSGKGNIKQDEILRQAMIALEKAKRKGPHSIVSFTDVTS